MSLNFFRNIKWPFAASLCVLVGSVFAGNALSSRPFLSFFPTFLDPKAALASTGAIVDGVSLDPARGVAGGSWVTIYGTNLAAGTQSWQAGDFVEGRAPTKLAGVSVTIGGQPAYVAFVGRGADYGADYDQINVLAPANLAPGTAQVEVTTPAGTTLSATVQVNRLVPGFFPFQPGGRRYIAATSPDGVEYIGRFGLFGRGPLDRPIRPGRRNELLTLYGAGCGPLEPPVPDGSVATTASRAVENVTVKFGDVEAEVDYAGAAPGLTGVCQFNVWVPAIEPGEWEVVAQIGNATTQTGVYITVAKAPYDAWDHLSVSEFRLTGAHVFAECTDCHLRSKFRGTPSFCAACHLDRYQTTTNPDHAAQGYPTDCAVCHITSLFKAARGGVNHATFLLTGAHGDADCTQCHGDSLGRVDSACSSCHLADYQATNSPNHLEAGYPQDCSVCHNTESFRGAAVNHSQTRFPLTGRHSELACEVCHGSPAEPPQPECSSCHMALYQATAAPNHQVEGYPDSCGTCHNTTTFSGAELRHPVERFALEGGHAGLECQACHTSSSYTRLDPACANCHTDAYNATSAPNHATSGYPQDCALCHTPASWLGADDSHSAFVLTGAHRSTACSGCHVGGVFAGTPRNCDACHVDAFQSAKDPDHVAAGFPQSCELCHGTSQFSGGRFAHTRFALTGAHTSANCSQCHVGGIYAGTPTACSACHTAGTNPSHAGFPTTCQSCHSTTTWQGASFTHSAWSLTGAHTSANCSQCHAGGIYAGTPIACSACHTTGTNPSHAGFPTTCQSCHSTTTWQGATINHGAFPIYSGKHKDKWTSCSSCHTNPQNFSVFSCFGCHSENKMREEHDEVSGFVYDSGRCYQCHPNG